MSEKIVLREITYEQMSTLVTELKTDNFIKDKEIERLNNRIEKAKHFIDQVLGYHLNDYKQLDKDVNELYGILMGVDKE